MRSSNRIPLPIRALTVAVLLACSLAPGAMAAKWAPPEGQGKGFTLGLGWGVTNLDVELDGREVLTAEQQVFERWGNGPEVIMGVGFGPRFRTEFSFLISEHSGTNTEYNVYCGGMRAEGVISPWPKARLQPEIIAGMGYGGLIYQGDDKTDYIYGWIQGNLGLGLRWRLNRHWTVDGQFVHSILDVERELSGDDEFDDEYVRFVGGKGHMQRLGLRLIYDF
jgi:opacity protein-like surface antigen